MVNMSLFENLTDPMNIVIAVNNNSNNGLGIGILAGVFIVGLLIAATRYDFKESFVGVSAACSVIAMILWATKLLGTNILFIPIGIFGASLLVYILSGR